MNPLQYQVILNPYSGKRQARAVLDSVKPLFDQQGATLSVFETTCVNDAMHFMMTLELKGVEGIIVVGGDGTMHEVVNGLLCRHDKKKVPIGVIPAGSGNAFMHDLNLLDPAKAAQCILNAQLSDIDILKVDSDAQTYYAFNVIGWGMSTAIAARAHRLRWLGPLRYNVATVIEIIRHQRRQGTLNIGEQTQSGHFEFMMACNTVHTGDGMKMAPKASMTDGLMDLVVVHHTTRRRLLKVFPNVFSGAHIHAPELDYHQVKYLSLDTPGHDALMIDGELKGQTPIKVTVWPKALSVYVPST